jgi:hypothetical protein
MLDAVRALVVGLGLVLGCGDASPPAERADPPVAPSTRLDLPRMDESPRVLVLTNAKPEALVWVGATGIISIKAGAGWRGDLTPPGRVEVQLPFLRNDLLRAIIDGGGPHVDDAQKAFARLDAERAAARRQALMRSRVRERGGSNPLVSSPGRLAAADVIDFAKLDTFAPLVIATPSAPASVVAQVLHQTGGVLAVDHLGKLAAFDLAFERERDRGETGAGSWVEVHVDSAGLHLTVQPEGQDTVVPWAGALIDRGALATAYRKLDVTKLPIDFMVRDDTTTQTLIEVLAAMASVDIKPAALVAGPATVEERRAQLTAAREGRPMLPPSVQPGVPNVQGELDKPTIQFTVRQHLARFRLCYERGLVLDPTLAGTVSVMFFIAPDGSVKTASGSGVHPEVSSCVTNVILGLEFPKPTGGGGVQVSYPFTFSP